MLSLSFIHLFSKVMLFDVKTFCLRWSNGKVSVRWNIKILIMGLRISKYYMHVIFNVPAGYRQDLRAHFLNLGAQC